jgi:hypothetical protein|tara:strand:- start:1110 stop:1718 length:609 start_codon:yes stop_codon:yes gene_type:complete
LLYRDEADVNKCAVTVICVTVIWGLLPNIVGYSTIQIAAILHQMVFTDLKQFAAEILGRFNGDAVIGIDGWTGVGKTCLANALANATGGRTFDLDTALNKDQKCYVAALRFDEIRRAFSSDGLLFVSGICLRQVLRLVDVEADAHVYVKRMAVWGWADEDELLATNPDFSKSNTTSISEELRRYHLQWEPHLRSTFEYHRPD